MALILFNSGRKQTLSHDKATEIWEVKQGLRLGTPEQKKYCDTIRMVFLNRHKAPQSYVAENQKLFDEMDGKTVNPWDTVKRGW